MKKIAAICLTVLMLVGLGMNVLAANGGFVESPTQNPAPVIESVEAADVPAGVTFELDAIPYKDAATLAPEAEAAMKKAYEDIKAATDLTVMVPAMADIAKDKNVTAANLAVADLFDLTPNTDQHGKVTVKMELNNANNFVALLHMHDGAWTVVDNAKVEGGRLVFTVDDFSPFAIVVNADDKQVDTGVDSYIYVFGAVAMLSAVALVVCLKKSKKQAAK